MTAIPITLTLDSSALPPGPVGGPGPKGDKGDKGDPGQSIGISVKDFGAVGDGVTDDTAAIQAAITVAQGGATSLYFPVGTYLISGTLNVTAAIRIFGSTKFRPVIKWTSTTLDALNISTTEACVIEGLEFLAPVSATAGSMITLTAASGANQFSVIRDCTFHRAYNAIRTLKAYAWIIENCYFYGTANTSVFVQNADNVDAGDSTITKCIFSDGGASSAAILQASSGGLRIINNKVLGGQYGYRLSLASGAVTSICLIADNSFELQTSSAISAVTSGGGATFSQLVITGNQFAQVPIAINFGDPTAFLSILTLVGNSIALNASGMFGIVVANAAKGLIDGNTIVGGGGTPVGIALGENCTGIQLGINQYCGLTTNVSIDNRSVGNVGGPPLLLASFGAGIATPADTTEDVLATISVPGRLLGNNGVLRIRTAWTVTNSANTKTLRIRYSGAAGAEFLNVILTTSDTYSAITEITNRNATNSQVGGSAASTGGFGAQPASLPTSAVDTTADTTVVITGQKASAGETLTLERYTVEIIPSMT